MAEIEVFSFYQISILRWDISRFIEEYFLYMLDIYNPLTVLRCIINQFWVQD